MTVAHILTNPQVPQLEGKNSNPGFAQETLWQDPTLNDIRHANVNIAACEFIGKLLLFACLIIIRFLFQFIVWIKSIFWFFE